MNYVYAIALSFAAGFGTGAYLTHRYYAPLAATTKAYVLYLTGKTVRTVREAQEILSAMLRQLAQRLN